VEGEELLLAAVESAAQTSQPDVAAAICHRIFADRKAADDVAILTLRFADGANGSTVIVEHDSQTLVAAGGRAGLA
jgi:hypothetical protein